MTAVFLVAAACKGGGGGGDWMKAKRVETPGLASGIAFTIQVPEGFTKAGDDKYPEWKTETVSFQVSSTEQQTSMEAASCLAPPGWMMGSPSSALLLLARTWLLERMRRVPVSRSRTITPRVPAEIW